MAFDLSPLTFGTVTGLFGGAGGDGLDLDTNPDGYVATGSFTFTPNIPYLKSSSPSKRIDILAVTATIDINGNLSRNGAAGVTLVATDGNLASAANLQYTVTSSDYAVNGVKQAFDAITIAVPAAGVDLVQAIPAIKASIVAPANSAINDAATALTSVWSSKKTSDQIAAAAGASINDVTASGTSTYSSNKTNAAITAAVAAAKNAPTNVYAVIQNSDGTYPATTTAAPGQIILFFGTTQPDPTVRKPTAWVQGSVN